MTANGYTGNTPGGGGGGGAVDSVNGRTGAVTLSKTDVGLANVDNTSDANKPVSTATSTALAGKAATSHTHTASQISDSTTVGRAVLVAADAPTARTAIGAGTSSLALGTTGSTAAAGNDSRLSDARTPTAHAASHASAGADPVTLAESQVTGLVSDLAAKAPLASPALTGTPTAPTATALDNSTKLATTGYADAADAVNYPMMKWNGSAYVVATGAKIYVGAGTPSSPADGSVWLTS